MDYVDLADKEIQTTPDTHICKEVFYRCDRSEPTWRYELTCPHCNKGISVFLPVAEPSSWGGTIPNCPFCGEFSIAVQAHFPFGTRPENNEITIKNVMMGGGYRLAEFVIYPQLEGESDEDRKKRIVAIVLEECSDISLPTDQQQSLIEQLYDRNPNIMHIAKDVLQDFQLANADRRDQIVAALDEITLSDDANKAMWRINVSTAQTAPAADLPENAVSTEFGSQLGFCMFSAPASPALSDSGASKRFCTYCGTPVTGKFCPACGTPSSL